MNQTGTAGENAQGDANNGQQVPGQGAGTANAHGIITPAAGGGLQLLAHASQIAENTGQVRSPTPTTGGGGEICLARRHPRHSRGRPKEQ